MDPAPLVRLWKRVTGVDPWVLDAVIATGLLFVSFVTTQTNDGTSDAEIPRDAVGILCLLVISLPYYLRRRAPLVVLCISTVGIVTLVGLGYYEGATPLVVLVGAYTVGAWCPLRQVVAGAVVVCVALVGLWASDAPGLDAGGLAANLAFFLATFLFGWNLQSRRERLAALEARADALEREREEEARRAVADERLRIAQELHDVVAHSMGVIAVQAGVGVHVIDGEPEEARRALEAISSTSRATLTEIRRMLGVLRGEQEGAAYAPAPGLDDLPALVGDVADAGVATELAITGDGTDVPAGVGLTAYRIVQEALTNVLKHAGPGATATVAVTVTGEVVEVEVVDTGRGVDARSEGRAGHGLIGMRERVAVYGGELDVGPRVSGGFRVAARLPFGARAATGDTSVRVSAEP